MADDQDQDLSDGGKLARFWIDELQTSEKWRADYWKRCKAIIDRYRNEWLQSKEAADPVRKFAILWANIQTIGPAVYAKTPEAVVTRRFKDADPVGRVGAEILERALNYCLSVYDFGALMVMSRDDYLLLGQGVEWERYVPHFKAVKREGASGEEASEGDLQVTNHEDDGTEEIVDYEEVCSDHVSYDDFGTNPARNWDEVWCVWRRVFMTRDELVTRFGQEKGDKCPLDWDPSQDDRVADPDRKGMKPKAAVYEIWDKKRRRVVWVNKQFTTDVLDQRDDPLGLTEFFPCPRPLLATTAPTSVIPIPDYVFYQDQAEEIDELTARIGVLTDALQLHGVYDASNQTTLNNVFQNPSNYLIPVENWAMLKDGGGLKGVIEWFPIENVAAALTACVELRKQLIDDVYQLTGISDIMRGTTEPEETAAAQGIKTTWGALRTRDRQKEIARFARDIIRIKAEIIADKFSPDTLQAMTGIKLFPDPQAKQAMQDQLDAQAQQQQRMAQVQAQQAQAMGQQPPPLPPPPQIPEDVQHMLSQPTWQEVMAVLKSNTRRAFQIDVETDSTIEPDEAEAKQRLVEYTAAVSQLLTAALPILQAFPQAAPMFAEIMKESARIFRVSRPLEEVIEKVFSQVEQMPPAPQQQAQGKQDSAAADQAKLMTAAANQTKADAAMIQARTQSQDAMLGHALEHERTQADLATSHIDLMLKSKDLELKQYELEHPAPQSSGNA